MGRITTVFLDRDGVINKKQPEGQYVTRWQDFHFLPRVKEAFSLLRDRGLRLIIITNQRGIARGLMTENDLQRIHRHLLAELAAWDVTVDAIYYCPHDEDQCSCRKPKTGMFLQAQKDFPDIEFSRSVVLGDSLVDIEAGERLGCHTILIADRDRAGTSNDTLTHYGHSFDGVASSLFVAVVDYVLPMIES